MSPLTVFIGKVLGLFCVIVAVAMMANKKGAVATVTGLLGNPPLMFVVDIMTVGLGLAMVVGHEVWSGGVLPVAVTLMGWATLLKGVVLLAVPAGRMIRFYDAVQYERRFYALMAVTLGIGLSLTLAAFAAGG